MEDAVEIPIEGATLMLDGRTVSIRWDGRTVGVTLRAEQALDIVMIIAGTFPPPPGLCGSGPNSCEGCTC